MKNGAKAPGPKAAVDSEDDWRADDDLRTLIAAEKVKADPARMKRAMAKLDEMKKALSNIKD